VLKVYLGFGGALALTMVVAPLVGSTSLDPWRVIDRSIPWADNLDAQIFFIARLPRVIAAALVGATLASAGVVVQALLRNPLATPFTLGVSSGSALGAMLALTFLPTWGLGALTAVPLASLAGAFGAVLIVYGLAQARHRGFSTEILLLAGVTLNAFFSALILLVQYLSDFTQTVRTLRWLMGDLDVGSIGPLLVALPLLLAAWALFAWLPRSLNVLALGAEQAGSRGVPVLLVQRVAFFSASLATGVVVSLAGPIGFVGIIVPHLVRVLVGADHRIVLPASFLFGGAFMVLCDTLARTVIAPVELPVGVVTATIGGPFFLWLLVVRRR
jgi:iron complex transport system permease protein